MRLELYKDEKIEIIDLKDKRKITIGRDPENDLILPDPHKKMSRSHCVLEKEGSYWVIKDQGSSNGTYLIKQGQEGEIDVRHEEQGRCKLRDQDQILILREWRDDQPVFWLLIFRDEDQTADPHLPFVIIEYSLSQQKLCRVFGRERNEIRLRPLEQKMIRYMAQKNYYNEQKPVVCSYEELITELWGDAFGHNTNEVNRLAFGIRDKIEVDSGEPKFLETVARTGYLLKNIKVVW